MCVRKSSLTLLSVLALCAIAMYRAEADSIHFKNGTVLNNVKLLREDWRGIEVQLSETVRMSFLRKEVEKIDRERQYEPRPPVRREYRTTRVPSSLTEKLTRSIAVNYEEPRNFLEIINNIAELYEINITIDAKLRERIGTDIQPLWTFTKEDGHSVSDMLMKLCADKNLAYEVSDDSILITLPEQPTAQNIQ